MEKLWLKQRLSIFIDQLTISSGLAILQHFAAAAAVVFFITLNTASVAQDKQEIYDLLQSAQQALDSAIQEATDGEFKLAYELVSQEDFNRIFSDFQSALQGDDLEALAKWFPDAQEMLIVMDNTPGMKPSADWLRQRLDYTAVASKAITTIPVSRPPTAPPAKPQKPAPGVTKPEQPKPRPVTPGANERSAFVRSADTWSKQLEGRPAAELSAQLVPPLKKIFADQGVPPELVWMAEVESTFNPAARSPAGAVGLFQLMPATAKHLGLQIEPDDQRLDPSLNGNAAARYLKDLYSRFEDWPLAIAAYNGGEGRVSELLKSNGVRNLDGISDDLPGETRMYVPKVLATIRHREGFDPMTRW